MIIFIIYDYEKYLGRRQHYIGETSALTYQIFKQKRARLSESPVWL